MRPFQKFRLWARRAPAVERGVAALVAVVVLASLVWVAPSPAGGDDESVETLGGDPVAAIELDEDEAPALTAPDAAGAEPTVPVAGDGSVSPSGGPAATTQAATAGGRCVPPPGSDQGVTDDSITIALFLVELAGDAGNESVNVPPAAEQRAAYDAMVEEINGSGGVACRELEVEYFTINPLDQAQLRQTCLDVVEAKVFYANDLGGYALFPAIVDCFVQNKIPFYEGNFIPQQQVEQSYPYLFAASTQDNLFFNTVFALKEKGFYDKSKGFGKLGYIYRTCIPEHPKKVVAWLQQAGVASGDIVQYSFGCPVGIYSNPSDIAAAVLRFQQSGVTHVLTHGASDWFQFSKVAHRQGFKPQYGVSDQSTSFSSYGTNGPEWPNIDGSILVSNYRFNEERTPGLRPTPGTERCRAIMAAKNQPDMYTQKLGMGGVACNQLWLFASAVNHAPELKRTALAEGLFRGGQIDFSFPHGPATFPSVKSTYHGNFWWTQKAYADCTCWRILDTTFRPTFPGFR